MAIVFLQLLSYSKPASLKNIEDHTRSNIEDHTQSKAVCLSDTALSINCPDNSVIEIISVGYAYLDQCNKAESYNDCIQAR